MRYLVIQKQNLEPEVIIWTKSQCQINNRESSHRDYVRNHQIQWEDVSSAGMVYFNPRTNQKISAPTSIDEKTPVEILQRDAELAKKEVVSFFQKNLSLKDEIQEDFDKYQAWEEHRKQVLAGLGR